MGGAATFSATSGADTLDNSSNNDIAVFEIESGELNSSGGSLTDNIDGGTELDTLRILDGQNIDLTAIDNLSTNLTNFEHIDLVHGAATNTLTLDKQDVLDITDANNTIYLDGDSGDTVRLEDASGTWTQGSNATLLGITYETYTTAATVATVYIQDDIIVELNV